MTDQNKYTAKLRDARILVIGGSSGIGYGVAEALVEYGAIVTISSSNPSRVDSTVTTLKENYPSARSRIIGLACDLGNKDTAEENIKSLLETTGTLDHIVFTATDALPIIPLQEMTIENMQKAGQIRFYVPLLLAKHAVNYLASGPKSSITFTGGVAAERPIPDWTLITGYTTGLQGIVRGLALDLKPLRINIVQPGMVDTNIYASSGIPEEMKHGLFADARQRLPVQKIGTPEDLAEAYLYLIRDENVTGEIVNSSGGQLIV